MAELVERPSPIVGSELYEFEPWSSQTNDSKIDACRYLAYYFALLG